MLMAKDRTYSDDMLLAALRLDSHEAFLRIFRLYYPDLVLFCGRYIADPHACEDIVQDVFVKIWEERRRMTLRGSLRSYLAALVHNRAIDELRRHKAKDRYISSLQLQILSLSHAPSTASRRRCARPSRSAWSGICPTRR